MRTHSLEHRENKEKILHLPTHLCKGSDQGSSYFGGSQCLTQKLAHRCACAWQVACNMDLAQLLLRLSHIQKDDSIFSPFSFGATENSHIWERIQERNREILFVHFYYVTYPTPKERERTHTYTHLWQPGDLSFQEQLRPQEIYFILGNTKLVQWSFSVCAPLALLLGKYRLVRSGQDYFLMIFY